jgi:hypothetical protein
MSHKPAGGLGSKVVRKSSLPKTEPKARLINPRAVSQLGTAVDPRAVEKLDAGRGYATPVGPTSNMGQGPGANRTLYGQSGTQKTYGPVDRGSTPPARDILSGFGPEKSSRG